MTPAAVELLKQGVALDVKAWLANVDADAQGGAILEQFLQRDDVLTHPVWKEHFQAWPPRGVVARLARRLNVSLSIRAGFYNFRTLADFKCEIKKIRRWYRIGRREVKPLRHRCRRIVRLRVQAQHVKIQRKKVHKRSIMTAKVELPEAVAAAEATRLVEMETGSACHAPSRIANAIRGNSSRAALGNSPGHVSAPDKKRIRRVVFFSLAVAFQWAKSSRLDEA